MEVLQIVLPLLFTMFIGLGAKVLWKNYFSKDFEASFPNLLKDCISCNCPPGWVKPVRRALRELSKLQKRWGPDLQVDQIKEKYGELRIYTSLGSLYSILDNQGCHHITHIIEQAEKACSSRCQICGKPGKHCILNEWHFTLCKKCKESHQRHEFGEEPECRRCHCFGPNEEDQPCIPHEEY